MMIEIVQLIEIDFINYLQVFLSSENSSLNMTTMSTFK